MEERYSIGTERRVWAVGLGLSIVRKRPRACKNGVKYGNARMTYARYIPFWNTGRPLYGTAPFARRLIRPYAVLERLTARLYVTQS